MFMIVFFLAIIAIIWLIIASIIDLKTREIPDWISYSLAMLSLLSYSFISIEQKNPSTIITSIAFGFLFSIIALSLYYTRQWGGGDVKLFISIGISLPSYPGILLNYLSPNLNTYFPIIIIINLILAAIIYSLAALTFLITKNKNKFLQEFKKLRMTKIKTASIILAIAFFIFSFNLKGSAYIYSILLAILLLIFPYLFISTKVIEKIAMIKTVPIESSFGEWLAEDIRINNKLILSKKKPEITEQDIKNLHNHNIKSVKIKTGVPFAPVFLLSIILSLLFGNLLFNFL